jgi:hypothetical protein
MIGRRRQSANLPRIESELDTPTERPPPDDEDTLAMDIQTAKWPDDRFASASSR